MRNLSIQSVLLVCLASILMGFCILPQGVKGHVLLEKNASMPLRGAKGQKGSSISTMVYIYEAASINQLIGQEGQYAKGIAARLMQQIRSDKAGKFKLRLAPGKYTIVLGYQEGIYIPYFSGNTGVAIVEVSKQQWQEIELTIIASSIY